MESQGSKQLPIKGNEDKREMTVILSCNMKGEMLPARLIYQGNASVMNNSNSKINNNTNFTSTKVLLVMILCIFEFNANTNCISCSQEFMPQN